MDYYEDGPPAEQAGNNGYMEQKDPDDNGKTALIPKSVTGGKDFEPGDEIVLEVVEVMEDELMVRYGKEKGKGEEKAPPEPSMSRAAESNESPMGSYMED